MRWPEGRRTLYAALALTPLLLAGAACTGSVGDRPSSEVAVTAETPPTVPQREGWGSANRHRGVAWTAGPDSIDAGDFSRLAELGVNWIAQTPFAWQRSAHRPDLRMSRGERVWWGERDRGIAVTTEAASAAGINTLLKPHIWLSNRDDGVWRGQIAMSSEGEWVQWFAQYSEIMLHYAALAEELNIPALCIGTELHGTVHREAEWRSLIDKIRSVYSGQLTYAANWYEEYEDVPFWDALDWIGVQAYFPLSQEEYPTALELETAWGQWLDKLEVLQAEVDRPVLFTEVGYRSVPYTAAEPWTWPARGERTEDERAFVAQADAYEALFRAAAVRPWLEGVYLWKWYPSTGRLRDRSADFTPQDKPAEQMMARWFTEGAMPQ